MSTSFTTTKMQKIASINCASGGSGADDVSSSNYSQQHKNDKKMIKNNENSDNDDDEDTDLSNSNSILEFLENLSLGDRYNNGGNSSNIGDDDGTNELTDIDSIFEKINRLSSDYNNGSTDRPVDEILREAEYLLEKQMQLSLSKNSGINCDNNKSIGNSNNKKFIMKNGFHRNQDNDCSINAIDELLSNSQLSQESTPRDMQSKSEPPVKDNINDDVTNDGNCVKINKTAFLKESKNLNEKKNQVNTTSTAIQIMKNNNKTEHNNLSLSLSLSSGNLYNSNNTNNNCSTKVPFNTNDNNNRTAFLTLTTTTNGLPTLSSPSSSSPSSSSSLPPSPSANNKRKLFCNKSTATSPKHYITATTSPIQHHPDTSPSVITTPIVTKEYSLKIEIDRLQEKLKDTEERLQSLRIQHDSLSQIHRDLRENYQRIQDESDLLKLDVQHLTECVNRLRNELQSARMDRNEAIEIQKQLQTELELNREEKKQIQEKCDKDTKIIQDLQRQCKEMERILIRKHPDSVSALIVTTKNSKLNDDTSSSSSAGSRRLLEQRIAQLESDAKEQDIKAQKILANVQARFNSVQAKYETHIADLETQVLSLQEINTKLNEKIELQMITLSNLDNNNKKCENASQTDDYENQYLTINTNVTAASTTSSSSTQTDSKFTNVSNNNNNRQIPIAKKSLSNANASGTASTASKMNMSHSDTTIASSSFHYSYSHQHHQTPSAALAAANAKEDSHLLATIRGMRIDLAIKDKAIQRLTRELDECKRTIKKLQKEKEAMKNEKSSLLRGRDHHQSAADQHALKEALNKIKLLESDYKTLKDKRLQDLKSLQSAHERELASCHETVRILQQRLAECSGNGGDGGGDENFTVTASQKRRKVPIDYYALKAKVSSLERRHSEREQRLHMLVEALSNKGRLNGALEEILNENNQ